MPEDDFNAEIQKARRSTNLFLSRLKTEAPAGYYRSNGVVACNTCGNWLSFVRDIRSYGTFHIVMNRKVHEWVIPSPNTEFMDRPIDGKYETKIEPLTHFHLRVYLLLSDFCST